MDGLALVGRADRLPWWMVWDGVGRAGHGRLRLQTFEEAVAMNNSVPQGLSSSLFTTDMKKVFKWMG